MKNINELIFRVNDNLRNNLKVDENDIKELLSIAIKMEKQLAISGVVGQSEQLKCIMEDSKPNCNCELNHCFKNGW